MWFPISSLDTDEYRGREGKNDCEACVPPVSGTMLSAASTLLHFNDRQFIRDLQGESVLC